MTGNMKVKILMKILEINSNTDELSSIVVEDGRVRKGKADDYEMYKER